MVGVNRKGSFYLAAMVLWHPVLEADLVPAVAALKRVQLCQFCVATGSWTRGLDMHILLEVVLAIQGLMDAEILLNSEGGVEGERLIAKRTAVDLLVLLLVLRTMMGLNGAVICTEDLRTIFTLDGQPVLLPAGGLRAVLAYVVIVHFK